MGKKIEWLAVLQGFSMLLVVIGHVSFTNGTVIDPSPFAAHIERIIYTFHMPLFIFISGWLFYYTCIGREKPYKNMLVSKVKRLVVPFWAFTLVTMALKMAFPQLMHRVVDREEIINTFLLFSSNPLGEMWFIVVLFELMLIYPVYRLITKNDLTATLGLGVAVALSFLVPERLTWFQFHQFSQMAPFFVAGILCCKYGWQRHLDTVWALATTLLWFVACNVLGMLPESMKIVTVSAGIAFSFSLCLSLARFRPQLFGSFRDYTFQIFLMGIFFQMVIRWIYVKFDNELLFWPLWLISVLIGVYAPTLIAIALDKYAPKYMKMCFGL